MWNLDKEEPVLIINELKKPWFYLLFALFFAWSFVAMPMDKSFLGVVFFFSILILHSLIDLRTFILPDRLTYLAILLGLASPFFFNNHFFYNAYLGFAFGFGFFYLVSKGYEALKGYPGMGFGDVKLLGMLGLWCGATSLPLIVIIASFSALFVLPLRKIFTRKNISEPLPFGPFLCIGGWVSLLYEKSLWQQVWAFRSFVIQLLLGN